MYAPLGDIPGLSNVECGSSVCGGHGRPKVFGSVLANRHRWTKPLSDGRVVAPSLSELAMPPSDAEQEGVTLSWSKAGVEVGARIEAGRELLATHPHGKWPVNNLPTTCAPEMP